MAASFISEVADLVATATGLTPFVNFTPEDGDALIASVHDTGGMAPDGGFSVPGIKYEHPTVKVRVRGVAHDDETPRAAIELAYRAFKAVQATTLGATKYLSLNPLQKPFIEGRDMEHRVTWTFNALAEKELSPS